MWEIFAARLPARPPADPAVTLAGYTIGTVDGKVEIDAQVVSTARRPLTAVGNGPIDAYVHALQSLGIGYACWTTTSTRSPRAATPRPPPMWSARSTAGPCGVSASTPTSSPPPSRPSPAPSTAPGTDSGRRDGALPMRQGPVAAPGPLATCTTANRPLAGLVPGCRQRAPHDGTSPGCSRPTTRPWSLRRWTPRPPASGSSAIDPCAPVHRGSWS